MEEMEQPPVPQAKLPWYFRTSSVFVALFFVGPLALPLVWINPGMSKTKKIVWTVVIGVTSYFMIVWTIEAMGKIQEYYKQAQEMLQ